MPEPAVGVVHALHAQRGDPLLQAPRGALRRRPVAEQTAEDRVRIGLAQPPEAQRGRADRLDPARCPPAAGTRRARRARRTARSRRRSTAPSPAAAVRRPAPGRAGARAGTAARRRPACARSALGQPQLGAQRRAGGQQVAPRAGRRVDRDDRLAATEALDRARHLLDRARARRTSRPARRRPSGARRSCSVTSCWLPGLAEMSTPQ